MLHLYQMLYLLIHQLFTVCLCDELNEHFDDFYRVAKKQPFQLKRFDTAVFLRHTNIYIYIFMYIQLSLSIYLSISIYPSMYLCIQSYTYILYIYQLHFMLIHVHTSKFNRKQTDLHYAYQMLGKHLLMYFSTFLFILPSFLLKLIPQHKWRARALSQLMQRWCPLVDGGKDYTFVSRILFGCFSFLFFPDFSSVDFTFQRHQDYCQSAHTTVI